MPPEALGAAPPQQLLRPQLASTCAAAADGHITAAAAAGQGGSQPGSPPDAANEWPSRLAAGQPQVHTLPSSSSAAAWPHPAATCTAAPGRRSWRGCCARATPAPSPSCPRLLEPKDNSEPSRASAKEATPLPVAATICARVQGGSIVLEALPSGRPACWPGALQRRRWLPKVLQVGAAGQPATEGLLRAAPALSCAQAAPGAAAARRRARARPTRRSLPAPAGGPAGPRRRAPSSTARPERWPRTSRSGQRPPQRCRAAGPAPPRVHAGPGWSACPARPAAPWGWREGVQSSTGSGVCAQRTLRPGGLGGRGHPR